MKKNEIWLQEFNDSVMQCSQDNEDDGSEKQYQPTYKDHLPKLIQTSSNFLSIDFNKDKTANYLNDVKLSYRNFNNLESDPNMTNYSTSFRCSSAQSSSQYPQKVQSEINYKESTPIKAVKMTQYKYDREESQHKNSNDIIKTLYDTKSLTHEFNTSQRFKEQSWENFIKEQNQIILENDSNLQDFENRVHLSNKKSLKPLHRLSPLCRYQIQQSKILEKTRLSTNQTFLRQNNQITAKQKKFQIKKKQGFSQSPQKQKIALNVEEFPSVTAQSWCVFNANRGHFLFGQKALQQVEIASLTKIMTLYVSLKFMNRFKFDAAKIYTQVNRNASKTIGTSALLQENDILSLNDLYYGLMLPSGNDAAIVISELIGLLLLFEDDEILKPKKLPPIVIVPASRCELAQARFQKEMNKMAQKVGLEMSHFASVHGLVNRFNISTAKDIGLLCCKASQNLIFKKIVSTKEYQANSFTIPQEQIDEYQDIFLHRINKKFKMINTNQMKFSRDYVWKNTNKLLWDGYAGLKTGITDMAGPCLASMYNSRNEWNDTIIPIVVIVLNCRSMEERWEECKNITQWALRRYFPKFN